MNRGLRDGILEGVGGQVDGDRRARQRGEGDDANQRALEFADIRGDDLGDERGHLVGDWDFLGSAFLRRIASRVSRSGGWMSVSKPHSNRERSRRFEGLDLLRRAIARDHQLLLGFVQRVEGVEELLLRLFLPFQELDIVDQEHVDVAVAVAEFDGLVVLDRDDEFVGEFLA